MIFAALAILSTGLFAGAALYINLVEHPGRMECGTEVAVAEFGPSYRRATVMQATLAAIGLLSGIAAWVALNNLALLLGAFLIGAVIPFTLLVIFPTNKQLLDPALDRASPRAAELLARWQKLHAVRTGLSILSFLIFLWGMS
jgi:Anthrone oxygenase